MGTWNATVDGTSLGSLSGADNGIFLLQFTVAPLPDRRAYHQVGVDGQLVVDLGDLGKTVNAMFMIISGSAANWYGQYSSLYIAFSDDGPFSITDPGGNSLTRCYLNPGSMRVTMHPQATGCSSGQVWGKAEAIFTSYSKVNE